jgi:hypothetical protein
VASVVVGAHFSSTRRWVLISSNSVTKSTMVQATLLPRASQHASLSAAALDILSQNIYIILSIRRSFISRDGSIRCFV